ncbi:MAG: hypothetical protein ER33_10670 [Cyanobium sp. CACIAM 14]|nr:MAG: hypothetical protein ER33_10670 [Cyanobium sp. CACIAM 14]
MEIVVYTQYYRTRTEERQREINECLRRNLNHPRISRVMLFLESDAPPLPEATVPVEVIQSNERMTYAEWFRWVRRQEQGIALLLNSDIYLDEGLEQLTNTFDRPDVFLALTRYNPGQAGLHLNDYPHWTQDVWGVRADADLPESLLYASSFPLGFPGCDNRIAYVMWSHGFHVRNPCYHVRSVHLQASAARAYDKLGDRLYGGVSYVHPGLAPCEDAELEFTIWTRSADRPAGVLVNQQAVEMGVHQLLHRDDKEAKRFLNLQQFTGMAWVNEALGSAHIDGLPPGFLSEDTIFLSMPVLLNGGVALQLRQAMCLEGLTLRLPRRCEIEYQLEVVGRNHEGVIVTFKDQQALTLSSGGGRQFWQPKELKGHELVTLELRLIGTDAEPGWGPGEGAELVLFFDKSSPKEPPSASPPPKQRKESGVAAAEAGIEPGIAAIAESIHGVIPRQEVDVASMSSIRKYGTRFEVLADGEALYFLDRFWPTVGRVAFRGSAAEAQELGEEALFAAGFLQPILEWKPEQIASEKRHAADLLFWQFPCRTEEDAYDAHRTIEGPQRVDDTYQVYVGLPWATFIDRGVNSHATGDQYPETLLLAFRKRTEAIARQLEQWGRKLQVHSVCQHIFWRDAIAKIKETGVTDLWISHKEKGLNEQQGVRLHSWSLYAVNDRDPKRRQGLHFVPIEQRPVFASFSGAYMKHYISDVRQRMASLSDLEGYRVTINDMWHFNKVVYNYQVFGDVSKKNAIDDDEVRNYNELLSHTQFSLCPVGAGPNTLRLWESLAVGSIPVVLSDRHELPDLRRLLPGEAITWEDVVVLHPEADLDQLDARLRRMSSAERHRRQLLCRRVYEAAVAMTCFGSSRREAAPIPLLQELFRPQQVQVPEVTQSAFTGVARKVPAAMSLEGEGPRTIVVHLDHTEKLLGFHLEAMGCSLEEINVTINRYREYNKFDELPWSLEPLGDGEAWLWLPKGEAWWAMGLKLTAQWKHPQEGRPAAEIRLAVLSERNAFAREARRLDRAGILKAASDRNAERQDDTFDTKHINSGLILSRLPEVARPEDVVAGNELFPPVASPTTNLIGEPLGDGITMYVHLMNRNENVRKNLPNWLQQRFDELILLDWSSKEPVAEVPGVFDDPRVRVVRVDGQTKFIRTLAQNLASRMARNQRIFKCDSDVEFKGDFFSAHPLEPGEFWVGDWHHARDNNERHLHGETYYYIQDFLTVGGYDERIKSYGQDDTNLKDRMVLAGLSKKVFDYDFMEHQHHAQTARAQGSHGIHPMVATYANRVMSRATPLWPSHAIGTHFTRGPSSERLLHFQIATSPEEATTEAHVSEAMNTIVRWYVSNDKALTMSQEDMNGVIWEKQVE